MSQDKELSIIILAAGQGVRMKSPMAKVLHRIGGKPMLGHVIEKAKILHPAQVVVVYGHAGEQVKDCFTNEAITWVLQPEQRGTADAVSVAMPFIPPSHQVLILYGDVPLISVETLKNLLAHTPEGVGLVTAKVEDPRGLGRIIRDVKGNVKRIVEEKEASEEERAIKEINSGIMLFEASLLATWLPNIQNHNTQKEFYLTDLISLAAEEKSIIYATQPSQLFEVRGVNDRLQQAEVERLYQQIQAEKCLQAGVEISDPHRFDVRGELEAEAGVFIDINVVLEGKNILHKNCHIGPHSTLINCEIGEGAIILAHSYLENVKVGKDARIGPFARLRAGTELKDAVHIGNFVEIKNSVVGEETKINHLSYIGDADIGKRVNIGAGTITCNYDGANKHKTIIEEGAHIGSDSQLIAPVRVGKGATLGAGSTLTKDAPAHQLTLTHQLEHRSQAWERPKKLEEEK